MSAYFLPLSGNIRKKLFLYRNTLRHTNKSPSSQQTIFFKTAQKLIWMLPWRHRKRSYLMYRLLNSSQIARATIGQRKMMIIDGTGTSVRWNTKGACWLHPTWDNVKYITWSIKLLVKKHKPEIHSKVKYPSETMYFLSAQLKILFEIPKINLQILLNGWKK